MEDIEFGMRLKKTNHRLLLAPDVQVTHRKVWTSAGLAFSDIFKRAMPWTRSPYEAGSTTEGVEPQHKKPDGGPCGRT
jgi:hypothetical protein